MISVKNYIQEKFSGKAVLIYDGECPLCARYAQYIRLQETVGPLVLINARALNSEDLILIGHFYDLDKGMLFFWQEKLYYGPEALNKIALLSLDSGILNFFNKLLFRHHKLSSFVYPGLVIGRGLLLRLLKRSKIKSG